MNRIQQTQDDLEKHLQQQISFLISSTAAYDAGYEAEAKRMAVTLRVLLHDSDAAKSNSKSLLGLLGRKDLTQFYDSAVFKGTTLNMGASLVVLPAGGDGKAIAPLDESPPDTTGFSDFNNFWNKPVLYAKNKHFTRKELVLFVSDQDGGAHVDSSLDEEYSRLSRDNSFGWKVGSGSADTPVSIVELATIRQIAHEVLRTLVPNYPKKEPLRNMNRPLMFPRIFFKLNNDSPDTKDDTPNNSVDPENSQSPS